MFSCIHAQPAGPSSKEMQGEMKRTMQTRERGMMRIMQEELPKKVTEKDGTFLPVIAQGQFVSRYVLSCTFFVGHQKGMCSPEY